LVNWVVDRVAAGGVTAVKLEEEVIELSELVLIVELTTLFATASDSTLELSDERLAVEEAAKLSTELATATLAIGVELRLTVTFELAAVLTAKADEARVGLTIDARLESDVIWLLAIVLSAAFDASKLPSDVSASALTCVARTVTPIKIAPPTTISGIAPLPFLRGIR